MWGLYSMFEILYSYWQAEYALYFSRGLVEM
jgi:hypothetical protein